MNDFNARVHRAIDKAIVRDHEAARAATEPVPVANRERVAEVLSGATRDLDYTRWETPQGMQVYVDALLAAGVFRDEAEVKADLRAELAQEIDDEYVEVFGDGKSPEQVKAREIVNFVCPGWYGGAS